MKSRILLSLAWVLTTFLLLSWVLYALNDYDTHAMAALAGPSGTSPSLERAKRLDANIRNAKTTEEVRALMDQFGQDVQKYFAAGSISIAREVLLRRVWMSWGVAASIPLLFLWWGPASAYWRRLQPAEPSNGSPVVGRA